MDAFLSKFAGIEKLVVGEIVDSLIEFLKKCKMWKELTIKDSPLEQTLYTYAMHSMHIELVNQQIDLNFLFKHRWFSINRDLALTFVGRLSQLAPNRNFDLRFRLKGRNVRLFRDYGFWSFKVAAHTFVAGLKELLKLA